MKTVRYTDGTIYEVSASIGCKCDGCWQDDCRTHDCDLCAASSNRVETFLGSSLEEAGITLTDLDRDYLFDQMYAELKESGMPTGALANIEIAQQWLTNPDFREKVIAYVKSCSA